MTTKQQMAQLADSPSMTAEEAEALQKAFLEEHGLEEGDVSAKINVAARLLMTGDHESAIRAYTAIMAQHPEEQGTCEAQIGAAHYFLGDYEQALEFYRKAKEHGEDPDMMDDNIQEAEEALAKGGTPGQSAASGTSSEDEGGVPVLGLLLIAGIVAAIVYWLV